MEFYEAVKRRRTIRDFARSTVAPGKIHRALGAGLRAPTYNHLREWDFVLVRDRATRLAIIQAEKLPERCDIEELERAFEGHDRLAKGMYLNAIPKQKRMLLTAPELVVVVYRPKTRITESSGVYDLNGLASVWCCIENILLAMAAEDLYGVTYVPQNTRGTKGVLGIPEELEIAALIALGYRAEDARVPRQKGVTLADKLHHNAWGNREE